MRVYPICLINLHKKTCVVVGGGTVAERKVGALLDCQAQVVAISPTLTPNLRRWAEAGDITHVARAYRHGDLEDAFLCIAATDDRGVNAQVWRDGDARGVLVNTVDDAVHSHFIAPATLRRGDLTIAISTGGHSPALAVRIKEKLASLRQAQDTALFGPECDALLQILGALRPRAMAELTPERRNAFFYAVVDDAKIASLLKHGDRARAIARAEDLFEHYKEQG